MEFRYKVSSVLSFNNTGGLFPELLLLSIFHFTSIYYGSHFKHPIRHWIEIVKTHVDGCILHEWHSRLNICSEIFTLVGKARERFGKVSTTGAVEERQRTGEFIPF